MKKKSKPVKKILSKSVKSKKKTTARAKKILKSKAKARKTPAKKAPSVKKKNVPARKKIVVEGELIGPITHYFSHVNAAVVKVKKGGIRIGDWLRIKGHTTDTKFQVTSMQMDHAPIEQAKRGQEIGIEVNERVRVGDQVYRIKP